MKEDFYIQYKYHYVVQLVQKALLKWPVGVNYKTGTINYIR